MATTTKIEAGQTLQRQTKGESSLPRSDPPLRIDSTIQLAWGLTLNFSHETTEDNVGKAFLEWLKTLRDAYSNDHDTQVYIDNLSAALSSYLRTSGFERNVYVSYLDTYKNLREVKIKNINDVADLASVSSGSFLAKLGTFLGFGSLAQIIGAITNVASPTQGLPFSLNAVLFGGLLGLGATVLVVKAVRGRLIQRIENESFKEQLLLWKNKAKPRFIEDLFNLHERLRPLVAKFYPNYTEDTLTMSKGELEAYLDVILPDTDLYKIAKKREGLLRPLVTME